MTLPLSAPIPTMSQAAQNTGSQFNVSAAVDDLKSRFMREWLREPIKEEVIRWNILKESLVSVVSPIQNIMLFKDVVKDLLELFSSAGQVRNQRSRFFTVHKVYHTQYTTNLHASH